MADQVSVSWNATTVTVTASVSVSKVHDGKRIP
jgi:hypothetical protein